ncbi:MAG: phosphoglycerate kinase [Candidatus Caldatribacteriota bacterium]
MKKRSIQLLGKKELENKRVLVRVDFNVPLDEEQKITNDTRIRAALPTINYLVSHQAKVILMSHLGRPKGKMVEKLRLDPVAQRLGEYLGQEVKKLADCIGEKVEEETLNLPQGRVLLLENLRFHPEEENNEEGFSKKLAQLGDLYVNDAFGTAHRAHASTFGVARILPSYAGFLMAKEIEMLSKLLEDPESPFVVILGGAKISGKVDIIQNLLGIADKILIAGGISYTCLAAQGYAVGKSLTEEYDLEIVRKILQKGEEKGNKIVFPIDYIICKKEISPQAETEIVKKDSIPDDGIAVDLGPESLALFEKEIEKAKTVFWNGPVGVFEIDKFARGTKQVARILAAMEGKAVTVIGGGDSVAAIEKAGLEEKITHLSTGGGASLEFLGGKKLPGIEILPDD